MLHLTFMRRASAIGLALAVLATAAACSPAPSAAPQNTGGVAPLIGSGEPATPAAPATEGEGTILTPEEALRRDAQQYADEQGITLDEAISRLSLQDEIGELNAALEANEKATFAGLWVQHQPEYRVVVRFTRDGEETIRRYVEGSPLAGLVEVRPAEVTLEELTAIQDEVSQLALGLGILATAGVNVQEGVVELGVTDRARLDAALQEAGTTLPDHVVVSEVERPQPLADE